MHTQPRTDQIRKIVLHTNEGPEGNNTAMGLQTYLLGNGPDGGGYQVVFDDEHTMTVQPDNVECWANGGINGESIDGCIIGYASQTPEEWNDTFDKGAIERAAQWFAQTCIQYGIPPVHLAPWQVGDIYVKGICGHGDVTAAGFHGSQGHTDPGPNFPWAAFIARIRQIMNPAPPVNWQKIKELVDWQKSVIKSPLALGNRGPRVKILNDLLQHKGLLEVTGDAYGEHTREAVHHFKHAHGIKPEDGTVFGSIAARAIL